MIEVAIPSDIMQYEATFIGPMTLRQTICVGATLIVEYGYYMIAHNLFPNFTVDNLIGLGVILAIPIMSFAIIKPYGIRIHNRLKYRAFRGLSYPEGLEKPEVARSEAGMISSQGRRKLLAASGPFKLGGKL